MMVYGRSRVRSHFQRYLEKLADDPQSFVVMQDRVRIEEFDVLETGKRGVWEIVPALNLAETNTLVYIQPSDGAFLFGEVSYQPIRGSRDPNSRDRTKNFSYKFRPERAGAKEEDVRKMIGDYALDIFFVERG